ATITGVGRHASAALPVGNPCLPGAPALFLVDIPRAEESFTSRGGQNRAAAEDGRGQLPTTFSTQDRSWGHRRAFLLATLEKDQFLPPSMASRPTQTRLTSSTCRSRSWACSAVSCPPRRGSEPPHLPPRLAQVLAPGH
ncbi:unnamed protein product, partial [Ectocarpus fasciculatus]